MAHKTEFLYLSEQDTIKAGVLDAEKCIDNAEEVFTLLSKGDYLMGGSNHNSHGLGLVLKGSRAQSHDQPGTAKSGCVP